MKKDWDAWGKFLWREEKQGDSWLAYFEVRPRLALRLSCNR
eukprot:SAG25_NODE_11873_length_293_cov_0.654639_1_plen_40_part_10